MALMRPLSLSGVFYPELLTNPDVTLGNNHSAIWKGMQPSTVQFLNKHQNSLWRILCGWRTNMTRGDNENNLSIFSRASVPTEEVLSTTGPILQFCSVFCRDWLLGFGFCLEFLRLQPVQNAIACLDGESPTTEAYSISTGLSTLLNIKIWINLGKAWFEFMKHVLL